MIMSITQGILYIPLIVILHKFFGIYGVIWAMTVTEIIAFVIGLILYILYVKKNFNAKIEAT